MPGYAASPVYAEQSPKAIAVVIFTGLVYSPGWRTVAPPGTDANVCSGMPGQLIAVAERAGLGGAAPPCSGSLMAATVGSTWLYATVTVLLPLPHVNGKDGRSPASPLSGGGSAAWKATPLPVPWPCGPEPPKHVSSGQRLRPPEVAFDEWMVPKTNRLLDVLASMASSNNTPPYTPLHGWLMTWVLRYMSPLTMKLPEPPPRMAWGPTLLSATIDTGRPVVDAATDAPACPVICWTPRMPARKGFHCGLAVTLRPHAPGGG